MRDLLHTRDEDLLGLLAGDAWLTGLFPLPGTLFVSRDVAFFPPHSPQGWLLTATYLSSLEKTNFLSLRSPSTMADWWQ